MKIFIDPGHGGADNGAASGKLIEDQINLKVGLKLRDYLAKKGVQTALSRTSDKALGIDSRARMANRSDADLVISIHHNAGKGKGCEIIHQSKSVASRRFAELVNDQFIAIGQKSRGLKTKLIEGTDQDFFGMLRIPEAPSVITEFAFLDNPQDAKLIDSDADLEKVAVAIGRAVLKYIG